MPLDGERLIIEPSFPSAGMLEAIGPSRDQADDNDGWVVRNRWFSDRLRCEIIIMEKDGVINWGKVPGVHHIAHDLTTLGCSDAWGIEQESNALNLLAGMLRHRQFKQYLLTGMFIERSERSNVSYIFRKLRPTVAAVGGRGGPESSMRILASLCMHPIAYYAGSWAGAMCPTDDVIAHLGLMRGDEHLFWKRCNQHPPTRPEAGL